MQTNNHIPDTLGSLFGKTLSRSFPETAMFFRNLYSTAPQQRLMKCMLSIRASHASTLPETRRATCYFLCAGLINTMTLFLATREQLTQRERQSNQIYSHHIYGNQLAERGFLIRRLRVINNDRPMSSRTLRQHFDAVYII